MSGKAAKMRKHWGLHGAVLLLWLGPLPVAGAAPATNTPPAKPAARPQAGPPYLASIFPAGGQRGQTVEVTVAGKNLQNILAVGVTGHGVTAKVIGTNKADSARLALTIVPDAELKERDLRVITAGGPSNRRRFMIGDLTETNEVEPNNDILHAQRLASLPVVINGQVFQADRDFYRFDAKAGQTLVFGVQARAILPYVADAVPGWCDACLTLYDAKGKAIESVDDYRFKPDPVMVFKVPQDGEYLICLNDILFRGRADFVYRLTAGALPYITDIFPLGGQRGTTVEVQLRGVNLPTNRLDLAIPADSPPVREVGFPDSSPRSNLLPFAAGDAREALEREPNDATNQATRVEAPANINGRIQPPGDVDYFVFAAQRNQRLVCEVFARRLDSPLDSILTLFNAKGEELQENDDTEDPTQALVTHHADSRMVYTFRQAGDYYLRIRDLQGMGGEAYAYRIWIGPEHPDFLLRITPDNPRIGRGETVLLTLDALRRDGFNGQIAVSVQNLPNGFTASDALLAPGQNQVPLTITAPMDAELGVVSPAIIGTATIASNKLVRTAFPAEAVMQAFSFKYLSPTHDLLLAVLEAAPFSVIPQVQPGEELELKQGGELQIPVKVIRRESVALQASISLQLLRPPPGLRAEPVLIAEQSNEGSLLITATKRAALGRYNIIISGTLRTGNRLGLARIAPALPIRVIEDKR